MSSLKTTYKFAIVIFVGFLIFLADFFNLDKPFANEIFLLIICIFKSSYFIWFVFGQIKETTHEKFFFHEFISFIVVSILLVIISYAIDFYCLFRIQGDSFLGLIPKQSIMTEFITFFYFSISVFTTAGFGDVKPNSTTAQIFVSTELMIAYCFTILILANISNIRESFKKKDLQ